MEDQPSEDQPRFQFAPFTFLTGFGIGIFAGVLLALLAFALVQRNDEQSPSVALVEPTQAIASSAPPTATPDVRPRTKSGVEIRLGPGNAFAVIGSMPRGEVIEVVGRDASSGWAAIRFPPGSAARGWLQVNEIEGLSSIDRLTVLLPTPLPRTLGTRAPFDGFDNEVSVTGPGSGSSSTTASSATPSATRLAGTPVIATGPTDLVVSRATLLPDGRVQVTIGNRGPGDLIGKSVFVIVRDLTLRGEQLIANEAVIRVGAVVTLQTSSFRLTGETDIQVIVDPFGSLADVDRSNNQLSITLAPAAVPTATRSPLE